MKKKNLRLLKTKRTWTTSSTRRKKMKVRGNKNKTKKCGIYHNWVDFILFLASGPLMGGFLKKIFFPFVTTYRIFSELLDFPSLFFISKCIFYFQTRRNLMRRKKVTL